MKDWPDWLIIVILLVVFYLMHSGPAVDVEQRLRTGPHLSSCSDLYSPAQGERTALLYADCVRRAREP